MDRRQVARGAVSFVPRGIIGVVHLPAMPGDPGAPLSFAAGREFALRDAVAWQEGGADALIVENFGSAPFPKGDARHRLPAHQVAQLALVVRGILDATDLPVGVNCLRNDARSALGIAASTGASFVRVNVHTGAYVTDQGLIEGEADVSLRYRASLGAEVGILADILVKHAHPLAPLTPTQATREALDRGRADAVIVSGTGTGAPADLATLREAREAAGARPVLLGSGLTPERAAMQVPLVDAAIVGTYAKRGGVVGAPVEVERVRALVQAAAGRFYRDA